jgi:hypothetical protein
MDSFFNQLATEERQYGYFNKKANNADLSISMAIMYEARKNINQQNTLSCL